MAVPLSGPNAGQKAVDTMFEVLEAALQLADSRDHGAGRTAGILRRLGHQPDLLLQIGGTACRLAHRAGDLGVDVADGALPGVMRGVVLDSHEWRAGERTLRLEDLQQASALMVCNALRGTLAARLLS